MGFHFIHKKEAKNIKRIICRHLNIETKNGPDVLVLYLLSFEEKVSPYITSNIYVIACLEQFIFYVLPSEDKSSL